MNAQDAQAELFEKADGSSPVESAWKVFAGKHGGEVRYLSIDDKTVRIDVGTGAALPVTQQSQGRLYAVIPGFGQIQERSWKTFMSKAAMARKVIEERRARELAEGREQEARADADAARVREREAVESLVVATLQASEGGGEAAPIRGGGGCKVYHGASTFTKYGPILNPHKEEFSYAKGFLWLLKAPIRAEWVKVYIFCANDARKKTPPEVVDPTEGVCTKTVREIMAGTGLSSSGAQAAIKGLEEYKLISEQPGKRVTDARRIFFHEHPWMEWTPSRVPRHGTPAYRDESSGVPRRETVYKEASKKDEEAARDGLRSSGADRAVRRDIQSVGGGLEYANW